MIKLEYQDAFMAVKVRRPVVGSESEEKIVDFRTWMGKSISEVLNASGCGHAMKPGDRISIEIEIGKDATWE